MYFLLLLQDLIAYGLFISCFFLVPAYCYLHVRYVTLYKRFEQEA